VKLTKKSEEKSLGAHTDTVGSVAFSSEGEFLATGGFENTVKLWNVAKG
jgi:WD40 repeat protein